MKGQRERRQRSKHRALYPQPSHQRDPGHCTVPARSGVPPLAGAAPLAGSLVSDIIIMHYTMQQTHCLHGMSCSELRSTEYRGPLY